MTARVRIHAQQGGASFGVVEVCGGRVSLAGWVFTSQDALGPRPIGLIRRIALEWALDGGNRSYQGRDLRTGRIFDVEPAR